MAFSKSMRRQGCPDKLVSFPQGQLQRDSSTSSVSFNRPKNKKEITQTKLANIANN